MSALPNNAATTDLLKWVIANPNKPFDPNMVVTATHTSDWQWQAVIGQMEDLRQQGYITKLKQDPAGSTYWTITDKGQNYLQALERAEKQNEETGPANASHRNPPTSNPVNIVPPPVGGVAPPVIVKAFGATGIGINRTTSLTFNITNPNSRAGSPPSII